MSTAESWTVGRLLAWTTDYLKGHGSDSPRLDAEVLLAEALGCRRIELYTAFDDVPGDQRRTAFRELVRRRAEGTPVAYLVGCREFYSLAFRVTPDVLIPRPETELLVVAVLDLAKGEGGSGKGEEIDKSEISNQQIPNPPSSAFRPPSPLSIADVGTGSGIIAVCLAKHLPTCRVVAIDRSAAALTIARENANRHGVAERIEFLESDLLAAAGRRQFDFVVSNPPYVTAAEFERLPPDVRNFEPREALLAGPKGTEVIERLIPQAAERLASGGHLLLEASPTIHDAVRKLLESDGRFQLGATIKDYSRQPRVVWGKKKE
jgi:release factor glutamine methyltransferase